MRVVLSLAWARARQQRGRLALSALAIVAASCAVVWVVSGYDALVSKFDEFAEASLGRYDAVVAGREVSDDLVAQLRADEAVVEVTPVAQLQPTRDLAVNVRPLAEAEVAEVASGALAQSVVQRIFSSPTLVGTDATRPPYTLLQGSWFDPTRDEVVLDRQGAELVQATVGDTLLISSVACDLRAVVVGVVAGPDVEASVGRARGPASPALYLPRATLDAVAGSAWPTSLVKLKLASGVDLVEVRARWASALQEAGCRVAALSELKEGLEQGRAARSAQGQAYTATSMALLAALFIIFTTASMGVRESVRELAMLRAVGVPRRHLAGLVWVEAMGLAAVGWVGGLGAGWILLSAVRYAQPDLFPQGIALGAWCVGLSGVCAFGGALAAAIWPMIRAARISPLAGMSEASAPTRSRWVVPAGALGVALMALGPVLLVAAPVAASKRALWVSVVGTPALMVGVVLVTPMLVVGLERVLSGLCARLLGLDPSLLASQLSTNLTRTVGTTLALSVGLALFVSTQVWGYSMLQPFLPGAWAPDALIGFMSGGIPDEDLPEVLAAEGIRRAVPLAVEQVQLVEKAPGRGGRSMVRQDNVILVGVDAAALGGDDPLFAFDFVAGDPAQAVAEVAAGRGCIVPDHFCATFGLEVGDDFEVLPVEEGADPVAYRVAGVVRLEGWHWLTKFSGVRRRSVRSAALVFTNDDCVRADFGLTETHFVWADFEDGATAEDVGLALEPVAARNLGERAPVNGQGTWGDYAVLAGPSLRITTPSLIEQRIRERSDEVLWGMSQLPLMTLWISALAVINTMVASVRARRWDMGILRAVGVTRWGLTRLVLAEALMVGLIACCVGLLAGGIAGACGAGVSSEIGTWGGMAAELTLPWRKLLPGLGLTAALCCGAGLWPALQAGRAAPLELLRRGHVR